MTTEKIELVKKLISDNEDFYEFADFGDGTDIEVIESVENKLGFKFSPSYKWWLCNYGGGYIGANEVYSVYEDVPDDMPGGDIFYMRNINLKCSHFKSNELVFMENELDTFYFDLNQKLEDGEYLIFDKNSSKLFAKDFFEFLIKIIELK